jgi:hypothetical protein
MTGCHATEFIKRRHQEISNELDDVYETVTVRLEAKNALMLKALSQVYQFPVSTSFTEIVTKHLVDILMSLSDDGFNAIATPLDKQISDEDSVIGILRARGVLPEPNYFAALGIPDFGEQTRSADEEEGDGE